MNRNRESCQDCWRDLTKIETMQPNASSTTEAKGGSLEQPCSAKPSCAERERRRNILGGVYLETDWNSDNLAVALMCYFEHHTDNPDDGQEDEHGNNLWAAQKVDEALDRIAETVWPNDKAHRPQGRECGAQ